MKQIAIITPGTLPVPCCKGGAVENLTVAYLLANEEQALFHFHVYTLYDSQAKNVSKKYKHTTFHFFHPHSFINRIKRRFYSKTIPSFYYNLYMDFYGHWAMQKIRSQKVDGLIIENRQGFILSDVLKTKIPTILHLHNDTLSADAKDAQTILNRYDKIITVSDYIKRQVDTIAPNDKTTVVYNGIDIHRFASPMPRFTRKDFHLDENDFVALYTGRIAEIKGVRELIEAFIRLKGHRDIKLLIVGSGNFADNNEDSYTSEVKRLAEEIKCQVRFTGYIPYEEMPSIMPLADVGIVPSICEEAFSLSALEDMAAGLPVIATRSGGLPEVVDNECALLVDKDDHLVEGLSDTIVNLHNNPSVRKLMGEKGRERSRLFDIKSYASDFLKEVDKTLEALAE